MAIFARVELHRARWPEDYKILHEKLREIEFYPTIMNSDVKAIGLPPACYTRYTEIDVKKAAEAVRGAANATGYKNKVVCLEFSAWWGYLGDF